MGQRLLLVDSDRSFLKEHQVSLESAFDLDLAASPEGVVARLAGGAYAAVLICVEVADNKGYALCSAIRKNPALDGVQIALISAKATEEEYRRHQSLKGRADLYLHKPIAPSTLVAALAPLVPGRALDPDNPFGELGDTELGDDWLDGLKSALEAPAPAPVPAPAPAPPAAPARSAAPAEDPERLRQLEAQVAELRAQLEARDRQLRTAEAELQDLRQHAHSVTVNLDEQGRREQEAEGLRARLAEAEARAAEAKAQADQAREQADAAQAQAAEAKAQADAAQVQIDQAKAQADAAKAQADAAVARAERAEARVEAAEAEARGRTEAEAQGQRELEAREAALAAKQAELEAALTVQAQLNTALEGLAEKHAGLEGLHQAALLEVANHKERSHLLQLETSGLEATMRGQMRDLAELGERLRQVEAELAASQAQVLEREQQIALRQEEVESRQTEITRLTAQLAALRQELDEAAVQHEGERLELMNALDHKEADLVQLGQSLAGQQEACAALEREKQGIHGQLAEHRDRLMNLDALLTDLQERARRGSELARG